jgi:hypothetical protein
MLPSSFPKDMTFDKTLEHVVVQEPVPFVQEGAGDKNNSRQEWAIVKQLPSQ